ncbi:MAG: SGNH/GDSL hydrolase family protein [Deltaproteobacteria bacterium]|nr:SGNH/GDSL hydrolase family protein [Deltaproteobacteria bacterium]
MSARGARVFQRYVAIGDSTTEGLDDPDGRGGYRGWANRLAEMLARENPRLLYANLAIRGLITRQIRETQLSRAVAMKPDLSTVVAGMNDLLRPRFDARAYGSDMEAMFGALVRGGATVLSFTIPDLTPVMPLALPLRRRLMALNEQLRRAALVTGAILVDFAAHPVASDPRIWAEDRLHVNPVGHARVAAAFADALKLPGSNASWCEPFSEPLRRGPHELLRAEVVWVRRHFWPWLSWHLRGHTKEEVRVPKRPEMSPIEG